MNKKRWFKRIILLSCAGFLAYDAVQGTYTGVMMHRYCAAEARYELYPNVELDEDRGGHCSVPPYPCKANVKQLVEFIPITGVMNGEQWIYIFSKKQEIEPEDPKYPHEGQAGFFRHTDHYFDLQGRILAKYVYFEPNGETLTPLGTMLYQEFAETEGLNISFSGKCYIPPFERLISALYFKEV